MKEQILEKLAELEHKQWMSWSKNLASDPLNEISPLRLARWKKLWRPYLKLTEEEKEQDRIWARKVLVLLNSL